MDQITQRDSQLVCLLRIPFFEIYDSASQGNRFQTFRRNSVPSCPSKRSSACSSWTIAGAIKTSNVYGTVLNYGSQTFSGRGRQIGRKYGTGCEDGADWKSPVEWVPSWIVWPNDPFPCMKAGHFLLFINFWRTILPAIWCQSRSMKSGTSTGTLFGSCAGKRPFR